MFLRYEPSVANNALTAARSNAAPVDGEAPARAHPLAEADTLEQPSRQGYEIHTSRRVQPCLIVWNSVNPLSMTIGPGFP